MSGQPFLRWRCARGCSGDGKLMANFALCTGHKNTPDHSATWNPTGSPALHPLDAPRTSTLLDAPRTSTSTLLATWDLFVQSRTTFVSDVGPAVPCHANQRAAWHPATQDLSCNRGPNPLQCRTKHFLRALHRSFTWEPSLFSSLCFPQLPSLRAPF